MITRTDKSVFIFDLDNTLFATFKVWGESFARAVAALATHLGKPADDVFDAIANNIPANLQNCPAIVAGKDMAQTFGWIDKALGFDCSAPEITAAVDAWEKAQTALVDAATHRLLATLDNAGAKTVIYTDAPRSASLVALQRSGMDTSSFARFYCLPDINEKGVPVGIMPVQQADHIAQELGERLVVLPLAHKKPHAAPFARIAADMDTRLENMVMAGDSLATDGSGAFAAGVDYVHVAFDKTAFGISAALQKRFANTRPAWDMLPDKSPAQDFLTVGHVADILLYFQPVQHHR